ncbi:hypothetical protein LEP1GSC060_3574 [Leptospira weilii serovar Ranarum str. ICFT]|uniref:Transposase domain protein n=1 Tax=Leptospira weilii serovar Ranarum str. ICFT TaxID=1218598 RepID=N1W701_9LEPT|nr:hypothetical protein LEP1GSC060_3574 [Leptospira weilii serovar Ranarum str. ICFT]
MNPGDLATIYQSLKKTDKEDSLKIAKLKRYPKDITGCSNSHGR